MLLPHNLICVDIETTSLDPAVGSIIQIGAISVNKTFSIDTHNEFNIYVKPLDAYRDFQSMSVNQISEDTLKEGYELNEALELFENFCDKNSILAAWGICFDIPFLQKQYTKINRKYPFSYNILDLKSIANWEVSKKNITDRTGHSLNYLLAKMNLLFEGSQHDALADIKNSVRLITHLLEQDSYRPNQIGWQNK